jgi:YidC/Oxa1 family membrane protein insertase
MEIKRVILYSALVLVVYSLWTDWQKEFPSVVTTSRNVNTTTQMVPAIPEEITNNVNEPTVPVVTQTESPLVHIHTDVLNIGINANGNITKAALLQYPESLEKKTSPFVLLHDGYVTNSDLLTSTGKAILPVDIHWNATKPIYTLKPDAQQLRVTLKGRTEQGLQIEKQFEFTRGSYLIHVSYHLNNEAETAWKGYMNTQFTRAHPKEDKSSMFNIGSYTGASYSNPTHHRYKKVSFKDMTATPLDLDVQSGWIAMQQRYFLSAWVPEPNSESRIYTRVSDDHYTIGAVSQAIELAPHTNKVVKTRLYLGPESADLLAPIAPGLDLTIDYGWLWFISSLLYSIMKTIYSFVGNWGISIVLVTVLIKLAFFKLSATSYRSMANMRKLQPKLQTLRERFGDDKAKMSQATMELYRKEKINPLGGCLPILVQIPVFIALYWVLVESVALRQAPFFLWIHDLAAPDAYHLLPILMGLSMLIQQKLNPAPPDPMQAKVMMFLPVFFTALFWNFPAGLVLYWFVNNSLSILQQWHITRKYAAL